MIKARKLTNYSQRERESLPNYAIKIFYFKLYIYLYEKINVFFNLNTNAETWLLYEEWMGACVVREIERERESRWEGKRDGAEADREITVTSHKYKPETDRHLLTITAYDTDNPTNSGVIWPKRHTDRLQTDAANIIPAPIES